MSKLFLRKKFMKIVLYCMMILLIWCRNPSHSISAFHYRSQLSICSEPMVAMRQLSCQSSLEPYVIEEDSADADDKDSRDSFHTALELEGQILTGSTQATIETNNNDNHLRHQTKPRPDSLILNTNTIEDPLKAADAKKYLYRSQSTRSFKKAANKNKKLLSTDLDQIYVISSNRTDFEECYDSIDVIHERRSKNFSKFNELELSQQQQEGESSLEPLTKLPKTTSNSSSGYNDDEVAIDIDP